MTDLKLLGSALLTEMHGVIGCDPNCVKNYHGSFVSLSEEAYVEVVGPSLTKEEWDAALPYADKVDLDPGKALASLAAPLGERCLRCGKALKNPVYVGPVAYGRVCVTRLGLPANQWVKPRSAFA